MFQTPLILTIGSFTLSSLLSFLPSIPSSSLSPSVEIENIRVIDGDTFIINELERVRVACINSAEKSTPEGIEDWHTAQDYFNSSSTIFLDRIGLDKYGRTIASVSNEQGVNLAIFLLEREAAEYTPYNHKTYCQNQIPLERR